MGQRHFGWYPGAVTTRPCRKALEGGPRRDLVVHGEPSFGCQIENQQVDGLRHVLRDHQRVGQLYGREELTFTKPQGSARVRER